MRHCRAWVVLAVVGFAAVVMGQAIPPELAAMADTERAFAKAATVKGWRDAFLDFFADDAIAFAPAPTSAKDRLRTQPSTPFSEFELVWEPRLGDVAASHDLGWLTGPSTSVNHTVKDAKPGHGCYLSIWRKQPDGQWRVFIDVGASSPEPVQFAPGFNRIAMTSRYTGSEGKDASTKSLTAVDREFNADIDARGLAASLQARTTPASRLHRPGSTPIVGADAIARWVAAEAPKASATHGAAEAAVAGDFGYSYGTFQLTVPKPQAGAYLRLWNRDGDGRWWLMVDVAQPIKQ